MVRIIDYMAVNKNIAGKVLFSLVLLLFFFSSLFAQRGFGRRPGMGGGLMTLGLRYDNFDPANDHQIIGQFSFRRPVARRGALSPGSYISNIILAGGARFVSGDSTVFRWRAGLLDAHISRKIWVMGVTLLDYDKTGIPEENLRWFNLRFGLGPTFGKRKIAFSPRLTGSVGSSRLKLGRTDYPDLASIADSTISGLQAGYKGSVTLAIKGQFLLSADYGEKVLFDTPEPHILVTGVQATLRLGKKLVKPFAVYFRYEKERVKIATTNLRQDNRRILAGISYIILPQHKKEKPDDWF